jgi:hypothetical protein
LHCSILQLALYTLARSNHCTAIAEANLSAFDPHNEANLFKAFCIRIALQEVRSEGSRVDSTHHFPDLGNELVAWFDRGSKAGLKLLEVGRIRVAHRLQDAMR